MEKEEGETSTIGVVPTAPAKSAAPRYSLSFWEVTAASGVVLGFLMGLACVYLTMPQSDYSFLKLPRNLEDLQILRDNLEIYTSDYTVQVLVGYCLVYVFMQTFMIPGTVFMSLLAGALFGVIKGMALVVSTATAGASSCYFLSKLIGRPLLFSLWPDKLIFFQDQVALLVTLSLFFFIPASTSVPFVLFYGIGGGCSNEQMSNLTKLLNNYSSSPGYCLEIGNGYQDSIYMPLTLQTSIACEKVKQMKELSEGYNIVAVSQGNLVARGVIEFCDNAPPVINYVSLGGPHAGVSGIPKSCTSLLCSILKLVLPTVYSDLIQAHFAPSGFVKIPTDIKNYLENSKYLPKLNNERPGERNSTFKDRFTSLHKLVLIMFESDNVLNPRESSWFGYYPDGAYTPILPPQKTKLYTEDWIGLKTLDDAGKVKFLSIPGAHIELPDDKVIKYVVPYLQNELSLSSERSLNHEAM